MEPLASKIRPTTLHEFVGQEHLTGKGKPLRVAIEKKQLFSFILWGPPGSGKTDIKKVVGGRLPAGRQALPLGKQKILFIDEIHRFNKAQQDFLLPFVERGDITLIGATTENPSFEII